MNLLNAFVRHHREWIDFGYSCFDRMLLRGRKTRDGRRASTILHRRSSNDAKSGSDFVIPVLEGESVEHP
jgi:hypothetical protein